MTDVPNDFLLQEIRLNREAITIVGEKLSGKVGRAELLGWLSATGVLLGFFIRL